MKKNILFILLLSAFAGANAQITFLTKVVNASGSTDGDFKSSAGVKNNSTDSSDTEFTWRFMEFSKATSWDISLCDPFECINTVTASTTHGFSLAKGQVGVFYADFYPNGNNGSSTLKVIVTSDKNPANSDTVTMTGTAWNTGVKELRGTKAISLYPNPVKDQVTIKFPTKSPISVDIYNILGVKVKSFTHDGDTEVSLTGLQNGVYFIRFTEEGKSYTKQFMKAQ